eukprot:14253119-Heterocapsa_arctica.AAC.1
MGDRRQARASTGSRSHGEGLANIAHLRRARSSPNSAVLNSTTRQRHFPMRSSSSTRAMGCWAGPSSRSARAPTWTAARAIFCPSLPDPSGPRLATTRPPGSGAPRGMPWCWALPPQTRVPQTDADPPRRAHTMAKSQ